MSNLLLCKVPHFEFWKLLFRNVLTTSSTTGLPPTVPWPWIWKLLLSRLTSTTCTSPVLLRTKTFSILLKLDLSWQRKRLLTITVLLLLLHYDGQYPPRPPPSSLGKKGRRSRRKTVSVRTLVVHFLFIQTSQGQGPSLWVYLFRLELRLSSIDHIPEIFYHPFWFYFFHSLNITYCQFRFQLTERRNELKKTDLKWV